MDLEELKALVDDATEPVVPIRRHTLKALITVALSAKNTLDNFSSPELVDDLYSAIDDLEEWLERTEDGARKIIQRCQ